MKNKKSCMLNAKSKNKGITLIALVITIIVLIILAAVAINAAFNSGGLFGKANEAAKAWNTAVGKESDEISKLLEKLEGSKPVTAKDISSNPKLYYGKTVTNYLCASNYSAENSNGVRAWKIFYADDKNIYLIADDYIHSELMPMVRRKKCNSGKYSV